MPPVTPRRMCLPCMGVRLRSRRLSHRASRRYKPWRGSGISRQSERFLPLARRRPPCLDSPPHTLRTERHEHPPLARRRAAAGEAARARRARALGRGAARAPPRLGHPRSLGRGTRAYPHRPVRLAADTAECRGRALRRGPMLAAPEATRTFLVAQLRDRPYEVFCCLYLDNRHRLIAFEELFRGTIDRAGVHPREVLRQTLLHNAAALIFAHNHPSGVLEPSQADELITRRLKEALALVDVRVLDHFIIGDGHCYSFSEAGLL